MVCSMTKCLSPSMCQYCTVKCLHFREMDFTSRPSLSLSGLQEATQVSLNMFSHLLKKKGNDKLYRWAVLNEREGLKVKFITHETPACPSMLMAEELEGVCKWSKHA